MMSFEQLTLHHPRLVGQEFEYMHQAVDGRHLSAGGTFSDRVSRLLEQELTTPRVLLTTSCTAALEMAALLLDPQPGDTVIVPSFAFVSSALAFARAGFGIVFADIESETLGIDPQHVADLLDNTTRAVVAIHYAGVASDLDGLSAILEGRGVDLIEDNAHGIFGTHRGATLGTHGRFGALSFHDTKNFVCGEGGALLVNDESDIDRATTLLEKGTNRSAFRAGIVDRYTWQDVGSSFGLADLNAAFLLAQLEERAKTLEHRRKLYQEYIRLLAPKADEMGLTLPSPPRHGDHAYHLFHILLPDHGLRRTIIDRLGSQGIQAASHFEPLHSSPGGRRFATLETGCPVTDDVSSRLIRLPFNTAMTTADIRRVVEALVQSMSGH